MVPEGPGVTLSAALKSVPELRELKENDKRIERLIDYALTLEGLARHCSTHAAGVVIAPSALTDFVPLFKGSKEEITTQYDMKMVEKIGLLKMDFLGLRTLTVIDDALRMIEEGHGKTVEIDHGFGYKTRYAHAGSIQVNRGQRVVRGDLLGEVGKTGLATAPHLHYEVLIDGRQVNPRQYLLDDIVYE